STINGSMRKASRIIPRRHRRNLQKKPPQWILMAGKIQHRHHLEWLKLKFKPRTQHKKNSNKPLKFLRIRTSNNVKPTKPCSNLKIVQSLYKTPPYRTACFFFGKCRRKIHF